jgi:hypothetical protein
MLLIECLCQAASCRRIHCKLIVTVRLQSANRKPATCNLAPHVWWAVSLMCACGRRLRPVRRKHQRESDDPCRPSMLLQAPARLGPPADAIPHAAIGTVTHAVDPALSLQLQQHCPHQQSTSPAFNLQLPDPAGLWAQMCPPETLTRET